MRCIFSNLLQAVSLIASYLKVPLRYPVHLGGSRSHIIDYAPSIEPSPSDMSLNTSQSTKLKHMEFPLYLDGQDTTRAAYAVFLLNKVHFKLHASLRIIFIFSLFFGCRYLIMFLQFILLPFSSSMCICGWQLWLCSCWPKFSCRFELTCVIRLVKTSLRYVLPQLINNLIVNLLNPFIDTLLCKSGPQI